MVRAGAPGFATATVTATKAADGSFDAAVRLEPAARIVGRAVVAGTHEPCAGAEVMLDPKERSGESIQYGAPFRGVVAAVADGDGRFVVADVASGPHYVRVQAAGFVAAETTVQSPSDGEVVFELAGGGEISGTVAFADGTPAMNARVSAQRSVDDPKFFGGKRRISFSSAHTDETGRFTIANLPEGSFELYVLPPDRWEFKYPPPRTGVATGTTDANFIVERDAVGLKLRGRVVAADGTPVFRAQVQAQAASGKVVGATSHDDGSFEIEGLDAVEYSVSAYPPGPNWDSTVGVSTGERWLSGRLAGVRPPRDDVVATLPLGASITGVLVDASGAPLARRWVCLGPPPSEPHDYMTARPGAQTDAAGCFEIAGLRPGTYSLVAPAVPGVSDSAPLLGGERVEAGTRGLRVTFGAYAKIRGNVIDEAGAPVKGARVSAFGPRGSLRDGTLDAAGAFEVASLDAGGQFDVVAWADGLAPTTVKAVASGAEGVRIVLTPGRRVAGRLIDKDGRPIALTRIVLRTSSCAVAAETGTDRDGRFTVMGLLAEARYRAAFVALREQVAREVSCGMVEADSTEVELRSEE
jgi:hypothetical protein